MSGSKRQSSADFANLRHRQQMNQPSTPANAEVPLSKTLNSWQRSCSVVMTWGLMWKWIKHKSWWGRWMKVQYISPALIQSQQRNTCFTVATMAFEVEINLKIFEMKLWTSNRLLFIKQAQWRPLKEEIGNQPFVNKHAASRALGRSCLWLNWPACFTTPMVTMAAAAAICPLCFLSPPILLLVLSVFSFRRSSSPGAYFPIINLRLISE